jgi:hypothetical protein
VSYTTLEQARREASERDAKRNPIASSMTLRDYFAAKAMQGIVGSDRYGGLIGVNNYEFRTAADAYKMADAMLKARES